MFDLEKYLTELKNEQIKKLEALNGNICNTNTCDSGSGSGSNTTNSGKTKDASKVKATSSFKFPISYLENKEEINENIINDLELIERFIPFKIEVLPIFACKFFISKTVRFLLFIWLSNAPFKFKT